MVAIHQLTDDSLHDVLEDSPDDYSEGSTKTASSCPTFPLGFGGMIFHVSHGSATRDGETSYERNALLAKNTDRQCHRDAKTARGGDMDGHSPPRRGRNLVEEFNMVGDQPVH